MTFDQTVEEGMAQIQAEIRVLPRVVGPLDILFVPLLLIQASTFYRRMKSARTLEIQATRELARAASLTFPSRRARNLRDFCSKSEYLRWKVV
jgi:hypothetical protein